MSPLTALSTSAFHRFVATPSQGSNRAAAAGGHCARGRHTFPTYNSQPLLFLTTFFSPSKLYVGSSARITPRRTHHALPRQGFPDYPDVRDATIQWVKDNCDVLSFTAALPPPKQQPLHLKYWIRLRHRANKIIATLVTNWNPFSMGDVHGKNKTIGRVVSTFLTEPRLPQNFQIVNCGPGPQPCTLTYVPPPNSTTATIPGEQDLELARRKIMGLNTLLKGMTLVSLGVDFLHHGLRTARFICNLGLAGILLILCSRLPVDPAARTERPRSIRRSKAIKTITITAGTELICVQGSRWLVQHPHLLANVWFSLSLVSVVMIGVLLGPSDGANPGFLMLVTSAKAVVAALFNDVSGSGVKETSPPSSAASSQRVSPNTSLQEDIQAMVDERRRVRFDTSYYDSLEESDGYEDAPFANPSADYDTDDTDDDYNDDYNNENNEDNEDNDVTDTPLDPSTLEDVDLDSNASSDPIGSDWSVVGEPVSLSEEEGSADSGYEADVEPALVPTAAGNPSIATATDCDATRLQQPTIMYDLD
ncbi:hypothetical protein M011DRAFT_336479 [Sporormia fimetaria CBS 119925]|uniref:Uncharacterized protein n=1 Tax=Sporormia fimetaria CBS 119925 TaxID=1340428 RepID=A0A6A6VDT3_9PLEO|nr:hypothetical protein M011DRAFT_336479 [Sporormia fimetaria CBS 119925]